MARLSSLRLTVVGAAGVAVALIGAYLSDCTGLGGGVGVGLPEPTNAPVEAQTEAKTPSNTPAKGPAGPRRIVVEGTRCTVEGGTLGSCEAACAAVVSAERRPVELDGVEGSHKTVAALRACLDDAGLEVRARKR